MKPKTYLEYVLTVCATALTLIAILTLFMFLSAP